MDHSLFLLIDGSLEILLIEFVGLPDMQKQIIVLPEDIIDLIDQVDDYPIDCIPMHSICHVEAFVLPPCHPLIKSSVKLLFPSSETHPKSQLYYIPK